jgi:hypothetical protein
MNPLPVLPIGLYRAVFTCANKSNHKSNLILRFTEFPGNAWRGALGYALHHAVCVTRQPECATCMLYRACLYPYFWETPPPIGTEKMRKYPNAPHPFILNPNESNPAIVSFSLIGHANQHLPVFIHALTQAAAAPRGISGNVLQLVQVEQSTQLDGDWHTIYLPNGKGVATLATLPAQNPEVPPTPADCSLEIQTPLRVKRDGRPARPRDFTFADLFGNLLRRLSMLTYFHTDTPLETDFKALMEQARKVTAHTQLTWQEQTRYSKRQESAIQLGGVIGNIHLSGTDLSPFWPYLWLGQYTHAGSSATMGMGRYRIHPSSPASLQPPEVAPH